MNGLSRLQMAQRERTRAVISQFDLTQIADLVGAHYAACASLGAALRSLARAGRQLHSARDSSVADAERFVLEQIEKRFVEDFGIDPPWRIPK